MDDAVALAAKPVLRSMELHKKHDETNEDPHYHARLATLAAKDRLSPLALGCSLRIHQDAGAAKHQVGAACHKDAAKKPPYGGKRKSPTPLVLLQCSSKDTWADLCDTDVDAATQLQAGDSSGQTLQKDAACQTDSVLPHDQVQQACWLSLPPLMDMSSFCYAQSPSEEVAVKNGRVLWLHHLIPSDSDAKAESDDFDDKYDLQILALQGEHLDMCTRILQMENKVSALVSRCAQSQEEMNTRVQNFTDTCVEVLRTIQDKQSANADLHEKLRQKVGKMNRDMDRLWHKVYPSHSASSSSESSPSSVTDGVSDGHSDHSESPHTSVADHLHPYLVQNWVDDFAECNVFSNACDVTRECGADHFTNPQLPRPGDVANGNCGQEVEPSLLRSAGASEQSYE